MSNGYAPENVVLVPATVGASATNTVVSKEFRISAGGSIHLVVAMKVSSTTVATGITAKLQTAVDDYTWVDAKTVAVTANGSFYIKLLCEVAGDQTYLPLLAKGRLVVSTGAGDAVTFDSVYVLQDE